MAPDEPTLVGRGGGGGGRSYSWSDWLTPLPPPGDLARRRGTAPTPLTDALAGVSTPSREQLFDLFRDALLAQAERTPTPICLEDVQWCDRPIRDAVRYLLAAARQGRWGLLCTFRPDEAERSPAVSCVEPVTCTVLRTSSPH